MRFLVRECCCPCAGLLPHNTRRQWFPPVRVTRKRRSSQLKKPLSRHKSMAHLVDVQLAAKDVELSVKRLQQRDDVHRRGSGAHCRETNQVAEQHRHVVMILGFDRLTCQMKRKVVHQNIRLM